MVEEVEEGSRGILSAREMEILLLVAQGLSNRQIANMLRLSETTVKRHLANAYPKMDVVSRGEAVRKALLEDWITIQDITQEEEQGEDADGRA
jgi:two-component system, NarL family, response regulator LiaR